MSFVLEARRALCGRSSSSSSGSGWSRLHNSQRIVAKTHTRSPRGAAAAATAAAEQQPAAAAQPAQLQQQRQQQQQQQQGAVADMSETLTLANIRSSLIRQEDTIIFQLIERAQYARNAPVYIPDGVPVPGYDRSGRRYSLLEYVLRETEQLHARVRRYTSPTEHPYFPDDLPPLVLPPITYPPVLHPCADDINFNAAVMRTYLEDILPAIAREGDDGNYGSAATLDVLVLQALSTRIHYGKFVAEAKFRARPEAYTALIRAGDAAGLMELLTDVPQERRVVERVRLKAATFGQDIELPPLAPAGAAPAPSTAAASDAAIASAAAERLAAAASAAAAAATASADGTAGAGAGASVDSSLRFKVDFDALARIYDDIVMPLTKEVQVAYLLRRLDGEEGAGQQA